jgi:hypothetical protein
MPNIYIIPLHVLVAEDASIISVLCQKVVRNGLFRKIMLLREILCHFVERSQRSIVRREFFLLIAKGKVA